MDPLGRYRLSELASVTVWWHRGHWMECLVRQLVHVKMWWHPDTWGLVGTSRPTEHWRATNKSPRSTSLSHFAHVWLVCELRCVAQQSAQATWLHSLIQGSFITSRAHTMHERYSLISAISPSKSSDSSPSSGSCKGAV
jgi:hypothetical protein